MTDQGTRESYRPRSVRTAEEDARFRAQRRTRRLHQELLARATIAALVFLFNELVGPGGGQDADRGVRTAALLGVLLNGPYYLAARTGRWPLAQAYGR